MTTLPSGHAPKHAGLIGRVDELRQRSVGCSRPSAAATGALVWCPGDAGVRKDTATQDLPRAGAAARVLRTVRPGFQLRPGHRVREPA